MFKSFCNDSEMTIKENDYECDEPRQIFYTFKEHSEIIDLIKRFPTVIDDLRLKERCFERFLFICDSYQEQPHLFDPHLRGIFSILIDTVKTTTNMDLINECFKYMHCVTKMRGYKKVVQHLPHEVGDLEPVLDLISKQDLNDHKNWQSRYMLLLWLSIVCMIPFDLSRFDSQTNDPKQTIMNRILDSIKPYLYVNDKCQDAAAYLLAKFVSRVDVCKKLLPDFYEHLLNTTVIAKENGQNFKLLGACKCISAILKYGKREDLLAYAIKTLSHLIHLDLTTNEITIIRKFYMKIIQRIGLTLFKEKIARWRYERGSRIILENLKPSEDLANKHIGDGKKQNNADDDNDDDDADVPMEVEDIVGQLLLGLKDRDTIVRWSAAKGIGRITNRLSRNMAEDILSSVLENFTFVEDDSAWQGVVPIILRALIFDKKLGNFSIGRNVRDAACYVCWSLARAFEPNDIKPFVNDIASNLLIASVFDREVNCRRAASAAFQENVGRQGQFPHGIEILTKADYFAVGSLTNCYLQLSIFLAQFEEYTSPLISHLLEHKFNHWDSEIRELTSQALHNLTFICPDYMTTKLLDSLLTQCIHFDLNTRHGAILSLSEIVHALSLYASAHAKPKNYYFKPEFINQLKTLIGRMQSANFFRGLGGEILRPSICLFIKKLALSNIFDSVDSMFVNSCDDFLVECFEYDKETVQNQAASVVVNFCDLYVLCNSTGGLESLSNKYIEKLNTSKEYMRCGYLLALGNLSKQLLRANMVSIVDTLMEMSKIGANSLTWVRSRKNAIKAIIKFGNGIESTEDLDDLGLNKCILLRIFDCFFNGLHDYTNDAKGDSGSMVREASIEGLEVYTRLCARFARDVLDEKTLTGILSSMMKQATERIDRTRNMAGTAFKRILDNDDIPISSLSYSQQLYAIFVKSQVESLDFNSPSDTFPLFAKALVIEQLHSDIILGFVFSIGALTESVVKSATKAFIKQLQDLKTDNNDLFLKIVNQLLEHTRNNLKNERLSTSLVKTVDLMIQQNLFSDPRIINENIATDFLTLFVDNAKVSKDVQKLMEYVDLFCDMLQFYGKIRDRCKMQLMMMLCHQYPKVRKTVATKLYETMLNYEDIIEFDENKDETITILTDTDWDQELDIIRPMRNRLCELINTPKPVLKAKK